VGESISFNKELSLNTLLWFLFVSVVSAHNVVSDENERVVKINENLNNLVKTILLSINKQMFGKTKKKGDEDGKKK